jgi:glycerol-3-phosphate acyltransferase PlsX
MRIGLDVMGGDFAPKSTIQGAILARKELTQSDRIVLIGDTDLIIATLEQENVNPTDFDIVHANEVIGMGEHPLQAFKKKPDSSIAVGFNLLNSKEIDTFSSAGNSGAILIGSIYKLNAVPGIIRPCIAAQLPKENGGITILLDVGMNPDPKPDVLYQFGILGSLYGEFVHDIQNPKVGLLNIGEEEEKGNLLSQTAYRMMKDTNDFNFIGNVEGRDFLNDKADVIVCDGFTGNVVLKQMESMYKLMRERGLNDDYVKRFNYENYGGTPVLGVNSSVVVGHGISSAKAIKNMILQSKGIHKANLSEKILNALRS